MWRHRNRLPFLAPSPFNLWRRPCYPGSWRQYGSDGGRAPKVRRLGANILNHMVEYPDLGALDSVYGALAHRVRRELVGQLSSSSGEGAKVTDLASRFEISLAAVSKHIRVLQGAGLVKRSIRGREHHLLLEGRPLGVASLWLEPYRQFWDDRLDVLEALLRKGGPS